MVLPPFLLSDGFLSPPLRHWHLRTLKVESRALEGNSLGDSATRFHPLLIPKGPVPKSGYPVVFVLAGLAGNGPAYFNLKAFEPHLPAKLDMCREIGEAPDAVFVFVDATTRWGGSQFINSEGTGRYEDHVAGELPLAIRAAVPEVSSDPRRWCVMGGSSGGYGALHLASAHPRTFGVCAAIAPDSFFEASLLPDIWTAMPTILKFGNLRALQVELEEGRLMKRKDAFSVLNAVAMGLCYSPSAHGDIEWPIHESSGRVREDVWKRWKAHDPIEFLRDREDAVEKLAHIFIECGNRDQHHLHFGARQIRAVLEELGIELTYGEFDGTHSEIGERRPVVWKWLKRIWSGS